MTSDAQHAAATAAQLAAWFDSLAAAERNALAARYLQASASGGATMCKPDGRVMPIPPLLTPEILDEEALDRLEHNAHALVAGLLRLTTWLMTDPAGAPLKARIFRPFGPLEAEGLARTWREAERLATVRVDYLVDVQGTPRALEVNATIPAMQGYSDIVAEAFLREVGRARHVPERLPGELLQANGRNTDQLLTSLLAHDRLLGGPAHGERRILIVHRAGDAQLGELSHLARRWTYLGHPTRLAVADTVHLDADGRLQADGMRPDLVYRHVFARRLDPSSDFARALLEPRRHRILNPIASHLEVKAMLGLLSQASDPREPLAAAVRLDEALAVEIRRTVPWTRLLSHASTHGPAGEPLADLAATIAAEPERFVIKRSWDYGGHGVFLGADYDEAAAWRAAQTLGMERPPGWAQLIEAAVGDRSDAWVAQALVPGRQARHLVAGPDGTTWKNLYVDLSVYTNFGVDERPRGGVSRAALGRIVNLQGGGGLAPLVRAEVIDRLLGT